jgi:hypothetical protein
MKLQTTTRRSSRTQTVRSRAFLVSCIDIVLIGHLMIVAAADDRPTIMLSHHNLRPMTIDVHVGEIVTWRSITGNGIELRFDLHPSAHEVIAQVGEVKGFFRKAGTHTYSGRLRDGRRFSGVVHVRERDVSVAPPMSDECDPSRTLCLVP